MGLIIAAAVCWGIATICWTIVACISADNGKAGVKGSSQDYRTTDLQLIGE